jgi:hypothetical protein
LVGAEGATDGMVTVMVEFVMLKAVWGLPLASLIAKVEALAITTEAGDPRVAFALMVMAQVAASV